MTAARDLAALHEHRLAAGLAQAESIDHCRARLVGDIDRWVTARLRPSLGAARVHTETVGSVIDRLAEYTALAYAALATSSTWVLGDAWERLAELAVGYEDLKDEVAAGHRRLPGGP
ncbi:DUF4254 domain-containing protein [Nocardia araoensis]|uniref:DUF4254 domain-containing protein n=1 Tax=Nocardia araoensis TaxID=228600 RepID=UPI0003141144|nr:DUF4254 domain-containing protein [Nocardia araoensis]